MFHVVYRKTAHAQRRVFRRRCVVDTQGIKLLGGRTKLCKDDGTCQKNCRTTRRAEFKHRKVELPLGA
eukprot:3653573-Alexandrium_andersonii.AAC.1